MKAYIISIAVSTVVCAVVNMLTPERWSKYVGVVTGLVITVCIAQPIISIMGGDGFSGVSYTVAKTRTDGETVLYDKIKTELEGQINGDIKNRLKRDFNRECTAKTEVAMTDNGQVAGIRRIYIYGDRIDAVIIGRLREIYGAEEVKYIGASKAVKKSE